MNAPEKHEERVITDELLGIARKHIGATLKTHPPFNEYVTTDAIRHFAHGDGDDNPLYCDVDYGSSTRLGGVIAPPMFFRSTGVPENRAWTDQERARARDPLSGIHAWYAGDVIHWLLPMRPGDQIFERRFLKDYVEKKSSFAGRTVLEIVRREYRNQRGELVVVSDQHNIRGGRQKKWGERKKYASYERHRYTPEDIQRIDEAYERETRRGAVPRHWEDVEVGDELGGLVKGPITITDIMNWNMGWGLAMQFPGAHRLAYEWRKAHPSAYMLNAYGVPDSIEAVHWDDDLARRTGNPFAYDYGGQRIAWLAQTITDWAGDDAWLLSLDCQVRRFVYGGDTVWTKGSVVSKDIRSGQHVTEVDVTADDQRGEVTATGRATVLLPSQAAGPVTLPPLVDLG